jgi:hypothetical protein
MYSKMVCSTFWGVGGGHKLLVVSILLYNMKGSCKIKTIRSKLASTQGTLMSRLPKNTPPQHLYIHVLLYRECIIILL